MSGTIIFLLLLLFLFSVNGFAATHPAMRVAMVQMDVKDGDLTENIARAGQAVNDAARMQADLVCLPEAADYGWLHQQAREAAQPIPSAYTDHLSDMARKHHVWICAGCLEREEDKVYNAAVLINRNGDIVLKHRKINTLPKLTEHLYDAGRAEDIRVAETEFGRVGLTICADNFDINHPRQAAKLGAWLLLAPHGFAAAETERVNNAVEFINHIKKVAQEAELWVIGTDTAISLVAGGAWKGYLHSGASTIASPDGKVKAVGKFLEPDLVVFDIPAE